MWYFFAVSLGELKSQVSDLQRAISAQSCNMKAGVVNIDRPSGFYPEMTGKHVVVDTDSQYQSLIKTSAM